MRGVIQRVKSASVTVDNVLISQIGRGVMVLVGLTEGDSAKEAEQLCKKVLNTRLWPGDDGRPWVKNVVDIGGEVLLVSQFTLYASLKKPRPDFHHAMGPQPAAEAYAAFVQMVRTAYQTDKVKDGVFGAMMDVELINDGPVTLIVDSQKD